MAHITEEQILEKFGQGFDCSQVVLSYFEDMLKIDDSLAKRVAAAFGGGMWKGRTCGAVSGALMAIGLKYGHDKVDDADTKNTMLAKTGEFDEKFSKINGSCVCCEILGHNLSTPEGMAAIQEKNLLVTKCPKVVLSAIEILEEMFLND